MKGEGKVTIDQVIMQGDVAALFREFEEKHLEEAEGVALIWLDKEGGVHCCTRNMGTATTLGCMDLIRTLLKDDFMGMGEEDDD